MDVDAGSTIYWPDWGALFIAVVALVQPWLLALWKRFFRAGSVEIYEARNVEVGFSTLGPTIGLLGTIRCIHRDVFIRRATLKVVRCKDRAETLLTWRAFRSIAFTFGEPSPQTLEPASSLLITPSDPYRYNVLFASDSFAAEYAATANTVVERWTTFVQERINQVAPDWTGQVAAALQDPIVSAALSKEFAKLPEPMELYSRLTNSFFWQTGDYQIDLSVECAQPRRSFSKSWRFTLTEQDALRLRTNIIGIINELCSQAQFYFFAFPEYQPALAEARGQRVAG